MVLLTSSARVLALTDTSRRDTDCFDSSNVSKRHLFSFTDKAPFNVSLLFLFDETKTKHTKCEIAVHRLVQFLQFRAKLALLSPVGNIFRFTQPAFKDETC